MHLFDFKFKQNKDGLAYLLMSTFLFLLLSACSLDDVDPPVVNIQPPFIVEPEFRVETVFQGLRLPTSLAWAPDNSNRLFVNELQSGQVRIIEEGVIQATPFASFQTNVNEGFPINGENGLVGITFDPDFVNNSFVYFSYTYRNGNDTLGRVVRYTDLNNIGQDETVLLDNIRCNAQRQVQSLRFGPDQKLYVSIGDGARPNEAQQSNSLLGKILRMNPDGSIPADNPDPNSYIYASGFRNVFDFDFRENGEMIAADIGTSVNDELNSISAGGNYGWPQVLGKGETVSNLKDPFFVWENSVVPTGMEFYQASTYPNRYQGALFLVLFGDTGNPFISGTSKRIVSISLSGSGESTEASIENFLLYNFDELGNPVDLAIGPDGNIYFTDFFQGAIFKVVLR